MIPISLGCALYCKYKCKCLKVNSRLREVNFTTYGARTKQLAGENDIILSSTTGSLATTYTFGNGQLTV